MNNVNRTLYIPLYGKALVSKKGIILQDKKAEEIWEKEKFPLKRKSRSKWLAYYMGMRSAVFDRWVKAKSEQYPDAVILHLGCGLDSRVVRTDLKSRIWVDVDFPSVIDERRKYYSETEFYSMIAADIKDGSFVDLLPISQRAIVILEGVSMYLTNEKLQNLFSVLNNRYRNLSVLVDCYTPFGVKMSKIKNPVNEVGVSEVYGIESSEILETNTKLTFVKEHDITPLELINELYGIEKTIFKKLYAGGISKKIYKLYEYEL